MRIGILADIHANRDALDAVLGDTQNSESRIDQWCIIGDVVGRGPMPAETLERLHQLNIKHWLTGNHDLYVMGRSTWPGSNGTDRATRADQDTWENHRQQLQAHKPADGNPQLWAWCQEHWTLEQSAPQQISTSSADFWLVHGALGDQGLNAGNSSDSYLFPWGMCSWAEWKERFKFRDQFDQLWERRQGDRPVVLIYGHTHVPCLAVCSRDKLAELRPIRYRQPQPLDEQFACVLVNPGSVGQPRNCYLDPHADYGILDTEDSTFEFRCVYYDPLRTISAMADLDYDIRLSRVLQGCRPENPLWDDNPLWKLWRHTYKCKPWGWEPNCAGSE
jgi:predicted phosphodiesterase